jgi:hypothetical protein
MHAEYTTTLAITLQLVLVVRVAITAQGTACSTTALYINNEQDPACGAGTREIPLTLTTLDDRCTA